MEIKLCAFWTLVVAADATKLQASTIERLKSVVVALCDSYSTHYYAANVSVMDSDKERWTLASALGFSQ